jgi:rhodanese-related sulfurtransferase
VSDDIEVGLDDLAAALEAGAPVIDVRNPDEYAEVHIPGVRLIPLGELGGRLAEVPRGERVYVVCAVGGRSLNAAKALNQAGYDAVSVAGGTKAWAAEGRPVEAGA